MFSFKSVLLLSIATAVYSFPRPISRRHAGRISQLTLSNPHPYATRFFRGLALLPYSGSHYWRRDVGYAPDVPADTSEPVVLSSAFDPAQVTQTVVSSSSLEPLAIEVPAVQEVLRSDDVITSEVASAGSDGVGEIAALASASPDDGVAVPLELSNALTNTESRIVSSGALAQSGIEKSIYVFVAPDAPASEPIVINSSGGGGKGTHYQIVFIKTPSAPAPEILFPKFDGSFQEKTLIYLLSEVPRQPVAPVLNLNSETAANKPEVFFIKYTSDGAPVVSGNGIQEPRVPSNEELAVVQDASVAAQGSVVLPVEEVAPPALDAVKVESPRPYRSPFNYYSNRRSSPY